MRPLKPANARGELLSAHELMSEILEMSLQRWVDSNRFTDLANRSGARDLEGRIYFLTQLSEIIRLLPLKVFPAAETRDKLLTSVQEALDLEIAKEEAL